MLDDLLQTADVLLALAAEHDAHRSVEAVSKLSNARLLELIASQAQLAVEPGRTRTAGIDALAELDRAAVELMGLPAGLSGTQVAVDGAPVVTGWDLITLDGADDLLGATTSVTARPWFLALMAFDDSVLQDGLERRVTAVTADMRFVTLRIRFDAGIEDITVLDAVVSSRLDDLAGRSSLAWGLWCALAGAVEPN